jgi:hypothetical protein
MNQNQQKNHTILDTSSHYEYYEFHKNWFTSLKFKHLSSGAKLLYMLLLYRIKNDVEYNGMDDFGNVYTIFKHKEVMETLGIKKDKTHNIFKELHNTGVIKIVRSRVFKHNIIYVKTD